MGVIGGIWNFRGNTSDAAARLQRLLNSQPHRARNAEAATFRGPACAYGMRDSHNAIWDERSANTIECQGIYAFVDGVVLDGRNVADQLAAAGIKLAGRSCAQLTAAAYRAWGLDFMSHLDGEFACAVWDAKKQTLILARDPVGHKPLHYYRDAGQFVFSSETKGILAAGVRAEPDLQNISDFLSLDGFPAPGTPFKGIYQVPPGFLVIASASGLEKKQYWSAVTPPDTQITEEEAVAQVTDLLRKAVARRMIGGETYCFLSGGMDSSAVLSFAAEVSARPVHAVSIGFEESTHNEMEYAVAMAEHVGAIHHPLICRPARFLELLDTLVSHHDIPFIDTSAYPTYYAAKLASDYTDLIITGDGPDQIIAGSGHHVFALRHDLFGGQHRARRTLARMIAGTVSPFVRDPSPSLMSKIYRRAYRDSLPGIWIAYEQTTALPEIVKKYLCTPELWHFHLNAHPYRHPESWFAEAKDADDVCKYLHADIRFYVPDDLMVKVDRMCMAHGLETLSPFQDKALGRLLLSLPGHMKLRATESGKVLTKYILRRVCENRFPEKLKTKPKQGFSIPLDQWLRQDNGQHLRDVLLDPRTLSRGYFRETAMRKMVETYLAGRHDYFFANPTVMIMLLTLELWHRKYIDQAE